MFLLQPSEAWPSQPLAAPITGTSTFRTPLGVFHANADAGAALSTTLIEIIGGVYDAGSARVRKGDVVIDLGAHLGVFVRYALERGAKRVIAFEANPEHVACLQQTFATEIESGRVVLVPSAAWSVSTKVRFCGGSLTGRVVEGSLDQRCRTCVEVDSVTIDEIVEDLGIPVDFIKADIEGGERHALHGARATLKKFGPRLALSSYHLMDDPRVLKRLVLGSRGDYRIRYNGSLKQMYCWT
jgi:FkbM family methyltransferase